MSENVPRSLATSLLLAAASSLPASANAEEAAWDCWIGWREPIHVHCIHARESSAETVVAVDADPWGSLFLDYIHEHIHAGNTRTLEELVEANPAVRVTGDVRSIKLFNFPDEPGFTAELVRLVFCRPAQPCPVFVQLY